jgi:diacylglycerol kinase family enzyme
MSESEATSQQPETAAEKIDVIINRRSGTVLHLGEDKVREGLENSLGARLNSIKFIEGKDIVSSVRQWTIDNRVDDANVSNGDGAKKEKHGLILGGGDGSVLAAAGEFLGRDDITLGVLPLGTHNLFARQLGFAANFEDAAKQYANVKPDKVDVGNVNGKNFLVGIMLDQNTVDFYAARELHRNKTFMSMIKAAGKFLSMAFGMVAGRRVKLDVSGQEHKGRIFIVSNNQFQPKSNDGEILLPTAKRLKPIIEKMLARNDSDGLLGFYSFKGGVRWATILPNLWDGTWTTAKGVKVQAAPELVIQPKGKAPREFDIILDGEVTKASYPLNVKMLAKSLKVYRPS